MPEVAVTFVKDARTFSASRGVNVDYELSVLDGLDVPFVWQHHTLFEPRGAMVANALQVPLVIAVEAMQVVESRSWGVRRPIWGQHLESRGEVQQLRRADLVTCVSVELAEQVADAGIDAAKILVTPNMVDAARFEGLDRQEMRAAHGLTDRFVVGWVGSFRRFHALDVLLDAFGTFALKHPNASLVLVGDGPEWARCASFAAQLPPGQVLLPGAVAFNQVPAWVSAFDVGVVPARAGQMFHYSPLKLQEYFAAHVATIAPDIGQVATTIDDGVNGFLYQPGDQRHLAQKLEELLQDPDVRTAVADTALAEVRSADYGTTRQLREIWSRLG